MVQVTQKRIRLGASVSSCFSHLFVLSLLMSGIGLVVMTEGTETQTLLSRAVSLRGGAVLTSPRRERS